MNDISEIKNVLDDTRRKDNFESLNTSVEPEKQLDRWTGFVVENNDPQRLGRVQIRIIGTYDDIPDYLLPWAIPDIGFIGSSRGAFMIPEKNSMLRGYFDKGDIQRPIFDAIAYSKSSITSKYTKRAEDLEYPNKLVFFETNNGDFLTLNRESGELVFTHRTGAQTKIDTFGNVSIATGRQLGTGNLKVTVYGDASIKADGKATVDGNNGVDIIADNPLAKISLGNNPAKQKVNNLVSCVICGAPHTIGNTQVEV